MLWGRLLLPRFTLRTAAKVGRCHRVCFLSLEQLQELGTPGTQGTILVTAISRSAEGPQAEKCSEECSAVLVATRFVVPEKCKWLAGQRATRLPKVAARITAQGAQALTRTYNFRTFLKFRDALRSHRSPRGATDIKCHLPACSEWVTQSSRDPISHSPHSDPGGRKPPPQDLTPHTH